ncbi:unnamed protein product [Polarella glacialis]|uniref:Uncharacterized protein n=1 Tax=Polarella glacialis TaxID=89957 RepID=A0A813E7T0_POLGL|nr:unnamed protein product [Polarella glacialis]
MASAPPRPRPASARGRLVTYHAAPSLLHGSADPAPESQGVQSGPGQFRTFQQDARHKLRDPLRHGMPASSLEKNLPYYALGRKGTNSPSNTIKEGQTASNIHAMDVSKVNDERHNWQRIDSFQTPYGNGQVAAIGVEMEDMRRELRASFAEIKEELALAVNQTIAELRQDVHGEAASLRQHLSRDGDEESQQVVVEQQQQPNNNNNNNSLQLSQEIERSRTELLHSQQAAVEEILRSMRSLQEISVSSATAAVAHQFQSQLAPLLNELREVTARVDSSHAELTKVVLEGSKVELDLTPVLRAVDDSSCELKEVVQASADSSAQAVGAALAEELQKVRVELDPATALEPLKELLAKLLEEQQEVDLSPLLAELQAVRGEMNMDRSHTAQTILALEGIVKKLSEQLPILLEDVKSPVLEVVRESSDGRSPVLEAVRESSDGRSPVVEAVRESSDGRSPVLEAVRESSDGRSPVFEAVRESSDGRSPILEAINGSRLDMFSLMQLVRENSVDLSPVLEAIEDLKDVGGQRRGSTIAQEGIPVERLEGRMGKGIQEGELSQALAATKEEIKEVLRSVEILREQDLPQLLKDVRESVSSSLSRCASDTAKSEAELQRVLREVQEVREDLAAARALHSAEAEGLPGLVARQLRDALSGMEQERKVDLTPVLRALQDKRAEDEEGTRKTLEELQKLRRSTDLSEVLEAVREVDSAKILRAIRECKVATEGLDVTLVDEVRRVAEDVRLLSKPSRELTRLREEMEAVKLEVHCRAEEDISSVIAAIKDVHRETPTVDLSEVLGEIQALKKDLSDGKLLGVSEDVHPNAATTMRMQSPGLGGRENVGFLQTQANLQILEEVRKVVSVVSEMDMAPVLTELHAMKAKIELASALKRQTQVETMTKAEFAAALEELRGHFSLVLCSLREGAPPKVATGYLLQQEAQAKAAQELDDLVDKLRDTQHLIREAGSHHEAVLHQVEEQTASRLSGAGSRHRNQLQP